MAGIPIPAKKQFICDCGRGYIRKEHLQRHKATHAYPSFTCPDCYKFFTRLYVSTLVLKRRRSLRYDENSVPEMLRTVQTCASSLLTFVVTCFGGTLKSTAQWCWTPGKARPAMDATVARLNATRAANVLHAANGIPIARTNAPISPCERLGSVRIASSISGATILRPARRRYSRPATTKKRMQATARLEPRTGHYSSRKQSSALPPSVLRLG